MTDQDVQAIEKRLMQTNDMIIHKKKRFLLFSCKLQFRLSFLIFCIRIVLSEKDLMNKMNTMTQQTGIWSRFKTAVMQPSLSEQSNFFKDINFENKKKS